MDDERLIRELIKQVPTMEGYSVSEARDGAEALELFRRNAFDLVITDFEMPKLKGNELVDNILRLAPEQWIIMVSAHWKTMGPRVPQLSRCIEKPFRSQHLLLAVQQVLRDD